MARTRIAEGFAGPEQIVDSVADMMADEHEIDGLEGAVEEVVGALVTQHLREQAAWPAPTDCDRLDGAFEHLQERGIIARQNYWCCQTCGTSAIHGEMDAAARDGAPVRGYVYYHEQDTERAAEGGGLMLAFGSVQDSDAARIAIAHEIVQALRSAGLEPEWDGDIARRIGVDLDWKRRRRPDGEPLLPETFVQE